VSRHPFRSIITAIVLLLASCGGGQAADPQPADAGPADSADNRPVDLSADPTDLQPDRGQAVPVETETAVIPEPLWWSSPMKGVR